MTGARPAQSWQSVQAEVLSRIRSRTWKPGEMIPNEADLAAELGCARATVNRALRALAETGMIERRRRAGTRVALHPRRKATLDIAVLRSEVEDRGETYDFTRMAQTEEVPPAAVRARMQIADDRRLLHILGMHLANGRPHAIEDRWIDPAVVPEAASADFARISPNEWLVANIPFEGGDIAFSAANASADEAALLSCASGAAIFVTERVTRRGGGVLTFVRLMFAPGYRMYTQI